MQLTPETLEDWRRSCDGESVFHETRILALLEAVERVRALCSDGPPVRAAEVLAAITGERPEPVYVIVQPGLDGVAWLGEVIDGELSPIGKVADLLAPR